MDLSRRHCGRTQVPPRNRSPVMRDDVRFGFRFVPPLSALPPKTDIAERRQHVR